MDKSLCIQLNASRQIVGTLRGYDAFMNLVLEEACEMVPKSSALPDGAKQPLGMVVIRGQSIQSMIVQQQ